jgi:hypothetical protein
MDQRNDNHKALNLLQDRLDIPFTPASFYIDTPALHLPLYSKSAPIRDNPRSPASNPTHPESNAHGHRNV